MPQIPSGDPGPVCDTCRMGLSRPSGTPIEILATRLHEIGFFGFGDDLDVLIDGLDDAAVVMSRILEAEGLHPTLADKRVVAMLKGPVDQYLAARDPAA